MLSLGINPMTLVLLVGSFAVKATGMCQFDLFKNQKLFKSYKHIKIRVKMKLRGN